MKYIITYLILSFSFKAYSQTDPPVLIIDLEKVGIYANIVDSKLDNLKIKTVVLTDSFSYSSLHACIEQENTSFTVRDNIAYLYFFDSNCTLQSIIEEGNLIVLSIKKEEKLMNVFIRSNAYIGIDQTLKLENLSFKEGNYIYNKCDKDVKILPKHTIDLSNAYLDPVSEKKLKRLLKIKFIN